MAKGVIYARYSSHNQSEASIEQQEAECRAFAEAEGISIVDVYADKAVSGRTEKRSNFQRMMRDAEQHKFEIVIAYKSNRIARNMLNALQYEDKLDRLGIKTLYAKEEFGNTASGRFALRMMMNINQFYSENMAEDIKRGMKDNAEQGKVNGSIPYGYRKGEDGKFEIWPERASVVKEIFERVSNGETYKQIADSLNSRGLRTKQGNLWGKSSFIRMLNNRSYIGLYHNSGIEIADGMPSIITEELFEAVHRRLDGTAVHGHAQDYILTGKLWCGKCGQPMVGICGTSRNGGRHYYYSCNGHRARECDKKNERRDDIEDMVVRFTMDIVLQDDFIETIAETAVRLQKEAIDNSPAESLKAKREELTTAISNIMTAIEQGIITKTTKARLEELETEVADIDSQLAVIGRTKIIDKDRLVFALQKLRNGDISDPQFRKTLVKTFVRAVYVYDDSIRIEYNYDKGSHSFGSSSVEQAPPKESWTNQDSFSFFFTPSFFCLTASK